MKICKGSVQKAGFFGEQKNKGRISLEHKSKRLKHAELMLAFSPVLKRIRMQHMLKYLLMGLQYALIAVLLLSGLSFLVPIADLILICMVCGSVIILLSLAFGWTRRPSVYQCARIADKMGLQEKVMTACELDGRDDLMAQLQRRDAVESLSGFDIKSIKFSISKANRYGLVLLISSVILLNIIPNPMARLVQEKKAVQAEIREQMEKLEKTGEELAAQDALSEEQKQELARMIEELADKLKNTDDYKEAIKEISKTEDELAALADKIREESLGNLASQLESLDKTQALAKALSDRDLAALESELDVLKEQLEKTADKEELAEKLKDALEKTAESMAESELKNSLSAAANKLGTGHTGEALNKLGEALKQAVNASNSMSEARYALQQMRSSISKAAGRAEYAQNQGNSNGQNSGNGNQNSSENQNSGQSGSGNQNGQGSQGSSDGQGSGTSQNGEGQGSGTGQGSEGQGQQGSGQGSQGNSSGQNGTGVGSGTTNQGGSQGSSGSTGGQNGSGLTGDENAQTVYERIYAPERLGDGGEVTYVPGSQTGEGNISTENGGRGAGELSGFIPYQDVYNEYRNEAMNSMDRRVLPPGIQELVREYFDSLGR